MSLCVSRFLTSVNASNCYLCWCADSGEGVIVDPAEFTGEMRRLVEENKVNIAGVFITHSHYDHDKALDLVRREFKVPVYAASNYPGAKRLAGNEVIEIGESSFLVASTPGHTEDSISFISEGIAFVGDALFAAAVGGTASRPDFEQEIAGVAEHVLSLSPSTTIYPGHGPATTVAVERCYNPFFLEL